ncbi:hypothetical protein ZOSMA_446G00170 [Zostera marina]|uniref:Uncharacterized protein n=1 Tax=Zostera marina TaxID=29655 RepID=A0A0K9P1C4_ZOSMR|nr:hypothetical protein ZOSMA_446G00170 [Zostera marina]
MVFFFQWWRHTLIRYRPLIVYAAAWTFLLTTMVVVLSLSAEIAFMNAVSPSSTFSSKCNSESVRIPSDVPSEVAVCLPGALFQLSRMDLFVPPIFAALVVVASVVFVQAIGIYEIDSEEE